MRKVLVSRTGFENPQEYLALTVQRAGKSVGLRSILKVRLILLDFADYLIYYTRKEVTYELLTHEYNYWR
jgi:hypothetical protein